MTKRLMLIYLHFPFTLETIIFLLGRSCRLWGLRGAATLWWGARPSRASEPRRAVAVWFFSCRAALVFFLLFWSALVLVVVWGGGLRNIRRRSFNRASLVDG